MNIKQDTINHLKNIPGWRTKRKLLIFSVDDFGNLRLDSSFARKEMDLAGLISSSIYDKYDTLESRQDLEALYEVLTSVKDINQNNTVFTPFAVPCNLNFDKIKSEGFKEFYNESLPETYQKLELRNSKVYEGTWPMWQEGMSQDLLRPQFHGREHVNVNTIKNRLLKKDNELLISLENNSLTSLSSKPDETSYSVAFGFQNFKENTLLAEVIKDGLNQFENVFGYRATCFMPPSATISSIHHKVLSDNGIKSLDTYAYAMHNYDENISRKELRWLGKKVDKLPMIFTVRNAVFEPILESYALEKCKKMIDAAFFMNKPAIVSSHRVNFVGSIDESLRTNTLSELKKLLKWVIKKYPNVEFVSMHGLQNIISSPK
jgi:hypothetical protein